MPSTPSRPISTPAPPPRRFWLVVALLSGNFAALLAILAVLLAMYLRPSAAVDRRAPLPAATATEAGEVAPPSRRAALPVAEALHGSPAARVAEGGAVSSGRRSAIPEPGEVLERPIPAPRLAAGQGAIAGGSSATAPPPRPAVPTGPAAPEGNGQILPWHQAGQHVGQTITIEGRVMDAHNTGTVCFLNFTRERRSGFYLIIFQDSLDAWPAPPQEYFLNRTVRAHGRVYLHSGRPQIRIERPDQLWIAPAGGED